MTIALIMVSVLGATGVLAITGSFMSAAKVSVACDDASMTIREIAAADIITAAEFFIIIIVILKNNGSVLRVLTVTPHSYFERHDGASDD